MTARFQAYELTKKNINDRVRRDVSFYSRNLRLRMSEIADYKKEFDSIFDGYVQNLLPNEEIIARMKQESENKKKDLKPDDLNIAGQPRVLPKI